jgi:radical SAM superfamily enzyme YgiQ (UPF0313 family)
VLVPTLRDAELIGMNVTYQQNLPFALYFVRQLRRLLGPEPRIGVGGTEVSAIWKYLTDRTRFFELFRDVDLAVVGEGEAPTPRSFAAGGERRGTMRARTFSSTPEGGTARRSLLPHYEDIRELPTPDFRMLPWDLYLSPQRFVYYSPTRGCYWNKCTFCDYGPAEPRGARRPTGYRETRRPAVPPP